MAGKFKSCQPDSGQRRFPATMAIPGRGVYALFYAHSVSLSRRRSYPIRARAQDARSTEAS